MFLDISSQALAITCVKSMISALRGDLSYRRPPEPICLDIEASPMEDDVVQVAGCLAERARFAAEMGLPSLLIDWQMRTFSSDPWCAVQIDSSSLHAGIVKTTVSKLVSQDEFSFLVSRIEKMFSRSGFLTRRGQQIRSAGQWVLISWMGADGSCGGLDEADEQSLTYALFALESGVPPTDVSI